MSNSKIKDWQSRINRQTQRRNTNKPKLRRVRTPRKKKLKGFLRVKSHGNASPGTMVSTPQLFTPVTNFLNKSRRSDFPALNSADRKTSSRATNSSSTNYGNKEKDKDKDKEISSNSTTLFQLYVVHTCVHVI